MNSHAKMWDLICSSFRDPGCGEGNVPRGTPFEELPDSWVRPICGADRSQFKRVV